MNSEKPKTKHEEMQELARERNMPPDTLTIEVDGSFYWEPPAKNPEESNDNQH